MRLGGKREEQKNRALLAPADPGGKVTTLTTLHFSVQPAEGDGAPGSCEARACADVALACTSGWGRGRAARQKSKEGDSPFPPMHVSQKADCDAGHMAATAARAAEGMKKKTSHQKFRTSKQKQAKKKKKKKDKG